MCTQKSWPAIEKKEQTESKRKQKKIHLTSAKYKSKSYIWRVRKLSFLTSKSIWGAIQAR